MRTNTTVTELSGHPATTVHRLHQLRPGGDAASYRDHPLNADLVVGAGEVRRPWPWPWPWPHTLPPMACPALCG
jgi:hypothetical protein